MITTRIHDATRPTEAHVHGPGRLAHAFPEGSLVALCGHTRTEHAPPPAGTRCAICTHEASRRNWAAR